MSHALRSVVILFALYGLVFAVGDYMLVQVNAPLWGAILFAIVIVGLQFLLGPIILEWLLPIDWINSDPQASYSDVPKDSRAFLHRVCAARGLKVPRLGVIPDGTPNAFTYGHTPANARIVVTSGLIESLSPDELNAVIAHELGHVEHWDFVVMTIATLVPMLLYQLYVFGRHVDAARPVAFGAYAAYFVSQFVVLLLSRTREYLADQYAANVTRQPNALSSALIKIALGMVAAEGRVKHARAEGSDDQKLLAKRSERLAGSVALMGISNVSAGRSLILTQADPAQAAAVMRWDVASPWAALFEIGSTHPLTARRVLAMNREAAKLHQAPVYVVPEVAADTRAGFPLAVALWAAPVVGWVTVFLALGHRFDDDFAFLNFPPDLLAYALIATGVTSLVRIAARYSGGTPEAMTIRRLLEDVNVSEMAPRRVKLRAEVVGRGLPGAFWSPDFVVRDETGMVFVLFRHGMPFARLWFALSSLEFMVDKTVTLEGWYRRGARPYVELSSVHHEGGRTNTYSWVVQSIVAIVAGAVGVGLL